MNEIERIIRVFDPTKWLPEKKTMATATTVVKEIAKPLRGTGFLKLAGLSGAVAVAMGAYGAHVIMHPEKKMPPERVVAFETANRYHLLHSIVLLTVPLARRPYIVGSLLTVGMTVFCGSCYYHSLTGETRVRKVTPYGGMLLIAAWLSFLL